MGVAFVCGRLGRQKRERCSVCGRASAARLCDGDVGDGKTCDAPLCVKCSVQRAPVETLRQEPGVRFRQRWMAERGNPIPHRNDPDPRDFCPKHAPAKETP
jgi:hypothetical protein